MEFPIKKHDTYKTWVQIFKKTKKLLPQISDISHLPKLVNPFWTPLVDWKASSDGLTLLNKRLSVAEQDSIIKMFQKINMEKKEREKNTFLSISKATGDSRIRSGGLETAAGLILGPSVRGGKISLRDTLPIWASDREGLYNQPCLSQMEFSQEEITLNHMGRIYRLLPQEDQIVSATLCLSGQAHGAQVGRHSLRQHDFLQGRTRCVRTNWTAEGQNSKWTPIKTSQDTISFSGIKWQILAITIS